MKVSEVTLDIIKNYGKIEDEFEDGNLNLIMPASKAYIIGRTGLTIEQIDLYEDITIAYCVLCLDMLKNREYTVKNSKVNKIVNNILDMHCRNLL
ncbi:MAG: head-tail connector protein [Vallitalea sp.]|nr:head-tail connector protein [Vallitalea sp.]